MLRLDKIEKKFRPWKRKFYLASAIGEIEKKETIIMGVIHDNEYFSSIFHLTKKVAGKNDLVIMESPLFFSSSDKQHMLVSDFFSNIAKHLTNVFSGNIFFTVPKNEMNTYEELIDEVGNILVAFVNNPTKLLSKLDVMKDEFEKWFFLQTKYSDFSFPSSFFFYFLSVFAWMSKKVRERYEEAKTSISLFQILRDINYARAIKVLARDAERKIVVVVGLGHFLPLLYWCSHQLEVLKIEEREILEKNIDKMKDFLLIFSPVEYFSLPKRTLKITELLEWIK